MQTARFSGLTCEACVKLLTKRLGKLSNLKSVYGDKNGIFTIEAPVKYKRSEINQQLSGTDYQLESLE